MMLNTQKILINKPDPEPNPEDSSTTRSASVVREKLCQMSQTLYKSKLVPDKISKLEKEALRGECASHPEAKPSAKYIKKSDLLTSILKTEHKACLQGTQIIKLPKLPFGEHKTYNEETLFKASHFVEKSGINLTSEKLKDLEDITRKFRLFEKKFAKNKRSRLKSARPVLNHLIHFEVYQMDSGELVCDKQENVTKSYDNDKAVFKEIVDLDLKSLGNTQRKRKVRKYFERKTIDPRKATELVSRLMPSNEMKESRLGNFFSSKYSTLFEEPGAGNFSINLRENRANVRRLSM